MSTTDTAGVRPAFVATYRLQLTAEFTFADAARQIPHISALGVSHLYLSPIGTAMAGSTHGYDWVPPPEVAEILGGMDGLRTLRRAASDAGLGIIVDIVPNHTGVEGPRQNPWWWDVLTHGSASEFAHHFDIDWAPDNGADGRIALPVLGQPDDVEALTLETNDSGATELGFYEHRFPLAPHTDTTSPQTAHDGQAYRLVAWDSGLIGYRRFFAVNGLAGMRQEDPAVYAATHTLVHRLVAEDLVDGLRVDHPDGLTDPMGYLEQLRADIGDDRLLLIEKVLSVDEDLDPALPVDGTTGYEALRVLDGVFVDATTVETFTELHRSVTGNPGDRDWIDTAEHAIKLGTLDEMFPAERARLARAIRMAARDAGDTDATAVPAAELDAAIGEVVASLGVYRADYPTLRSRLDATFDEVRDRLPELGSAIRMIADAVASDGEPSARLAQVCGATTAKSVEDCLFYRTARLVGLQEVGGDPGRFGTTVDEFHAFNVARARDWPSAMTTLSTHDTKRGEDVRARIGLLTRYPDQFSELVASMVSATPPPDAVTGLFLVQNIIGVWPLDGVPDASVRERLHDFTTKAIREAALVTSWTDSDDEMESAIHSWVDDVLDGPVGVGISGLIETMRADIVDVCVAHKALGLLVPGFGDIYQGTEWFEDTLVDPDNRRPVDFGQSLNHPKTAVVTAALALRRDHPASFGADGAYAPVYATGPAADEVVAFARGTDVLVLAARVRITDPDAAAATVVELPAGRWRSRTTTDEFSGTVSVADAFAQGPVALLELLD
ncbi:malto-oligosyltrehalose synthase [Williamsia phyllosphaerae]|uniref:Malto-oligosyltrehalose synthase n=1 Tax=Williamsia phyllosphaerae TaxID=885042 RepID=A0ABQ1UYA5_9NOCA|nr:malto-oligosyltrehalose synthase [Williamsia phyllosphaerae]GGF29853.1 malto-oligosyltrehalose synthase [Williamsia phyllosphaerae]